MSRMLYCDLHTHSTASDGSTPPADLGPLARHAALAAVALTDHDTTTGLADAAASCAALDIAFVPGIELSCRRGKPLGTLHLLGYFIDPASPMLADVCAELQQARNERAPQIVVKLNELGVDITLDEVLAESNSGGGRGSVGRPHIGAVLVRKGYVKTIKDAFTRYIGQGAPAYVRKDNLIPQRAIAAVHDAGGLAVLAHPVQLRCDDEEELLEFIRDLRDAGLDGLECRHCDHTPALTQHYLHLAKRLDLIPTGGSDFHGPRKAVPLGSARVPFTCYQSLLDAHNTVKR
ncbi:MAG: PHP domain-containing protein [Phycisphaerales bacterium]